MNEVWVEFAGDVFLSFWRLWLRSFFINFKLCSRFSQFELWYSMTDRCTSCLYLLNYVIVRVFAHFCMTVVFIYTETITFFINFFNYLYYFLLDSRRVEPNASCLFSFFNYLYFYCWIQNFINFIFSFLYIYFLKMSTFSINYNFHCFFEFRHAVHRLNSTRAAHVMSSYTFVYSFIGLYKRGVARKHFITFQVSFMLLVTKFFTYFIRARQPFKFIQALQLIWVNFIWNRTWMFKLLSLIVIETHHRSSSWYRSSLFSFNLLSF